MLGVAPQGCPKGPRAGLKRITYFQRKFQTFFPPNFVVQTVVKKITGYAGSCYSPNLFLTIALSLFRTTILIIVRIETTIPRCYCHRFLHCSRHRLRLCSRHRLRHCSRHRLRHCFCHCRCRPHY